MHSRKHEEIKPSYLIKVAEILTAESATTFKPVSERNQKFNK